MDEIGLFDEERLTQVKRIVDAMCNALEVKIIAYVKAMTADCRASSEDSGLATVWEEFKYQMQREESLYFDAYEAEIRRICRFEVESLDRLRQGLICPLGRALRASLPSASRRLLRNIECRYCFIKSARPNGNSVHSRG